MNNYIDRKSYEFKQGYQGGVFWFTGLSGAGKSTLASCVEKELFNLGINVIVLDGDIIRSGLCSDLSFELKDRFENIRRTAELCKLLTQKGLVCLCAFITPLSSFRNLAHNILKDDYHEIFISCPLPICEQRDVKGFYKLARGGKIKNYTGLTSPYQSPANPELVIKTDSSTIEECTIQITNFILKKINYPT